MIAKLIIKNVVDFADKINLIEINVNTKFQFKLVVLM